MHLEPCWRRRIASFISAVRSRSPQNRPDGRLHEIEHPRTLTRRTDAVHVVESSRFGRSEGPSGAHRRTPRGSHGPARDARSGRARSLAEDLEHAVTQLDGTITGRIVAFGREDASSGTGYGTVTCSGLAACVTSRSRPAIDCRLGKPDSMLIRAVVAVLAFALVLVGFSQVLHDVQFEIAHLGWAILISLPVGLSVLWGSLGTERLEYPNSTFGVLMFWILSVGPWLIAEAPDPVFDLRLSDESIIVGRLLFLLWCLLFTVSAGRPLQGLARLNPRTVDAVALCIPIAGSLAIQLASGQFSDYQAGRNSGEASSTTIIIAMSLGRNTLEFLPGFFLLLSKRSRSSTLIWLSRVCGFLSIPLMLLAGGRRAIAFAAGYAFLFARLSGIRFRLGISIVAALAVPACFFFVFTYRTALSNADIETASLSDLTFIASDTAKTLARGEEVRGHAVLDFSENVRVRMGIGPQFYAVVDSWLAKGPAFEGTYLDGLISVLPVYFFPEKNQLAVKHNLEFTLQAQGILPDVDLSPTPWMHWLYEFGLIGIIVGAVISGRLVRFLERRLILTDSLFELVFWTYLLSAIYPAETTIDSIFLIAREAAVLVSLSWILSTTLRLATRLTRTGSAPRSDISDSNIEARVQH